MTLCAGTCSWTRRGGCVVSLSEPLLKLRPRKDLIETLIHEMIHAFVFLTGGDLNREHHGPRFLSKMNEINRREGLKISVYHSFHDEVNVYRTHRWRCNGPCRDRRPFYGFVSRSMNRPPGKYDRWFPEHQRSCGGVFIKIAEPEGYGQKKKKETKKPNLPSNAGVKPIDEYFKTPKDLEPSSSSKSTEPVTETKVEVITVDDMETLSEQAPCPICQMMMRVEEIFEHVDVCTDIREELDNDTGSVPTIDKEDSEERDVASTVREAWLKRFDSPVASTSTAFPKSPKRLKLETCADLAKSQEPVTHRCPTCLLQLDAEPESQTIHVLECSSKSEDLQKCPMCDVAFALPELLQHAQICSGGA